MSSGEPLRSPAAVVLAVEDLLVPFQSLRAWQWAWRPQGPLLSERHVLMVLRRSRRSWDRRRWLGLIGKAPPAEASALAEHLAQTLRAIAGRGLPAEETAAVVRRLLRPTGEVERFPDVAPALERLRAGGLRVGALTSLPAESARWLLRRVGLDAGLLLGAGDPPGPSVPAREAFRAAAERLGADPGRTVSVGSLYWSEVRAAQRAGLRGLLVDRTTVWPHVRGGRVTDLTGLDEALRATASADAPAEAAEPDPRGAEDSSSGDFL